MCFDEVVRLSLQRSCFPIMRTGERVIIVNGGRRDTSPHSLRSLRQDVVTVVRLSVRGQ